MPNGDNFSMEGYRELVCSYREMGRSSSDLKLRPAWRRVRTFEKPRLRAAYRRDSVFDVCD